MPASKPKRVIVNCPQCSTHFTVEKKFTERNVTCPTCKTLIMVACDLPGAKLATTPKDGEGECEAAEDPTRFQQPEPSVPNSWTRGYVHWPTQADPPSHNSTLPHVDILPNRPPVVSGKIFLVCHGCMAEFFVGQSFAGRSGPCPKCEAIITVPYGLPLSKQALVERAMPAQSIYRFEAIDAATGRDICDTVIAANEAEALAAIRMMGYMITKITTQESETAADPSLSRGELESVFSIGPVGLSALALFVCASFTFVGWLLWHDSHVRRMKADNRCSNAISAAKTWLESNNSSTDEERIVNDLEQSMADASTPGVRHSELQDILQRVREDAQRRRVEELFAAAEKELARQRIKEGIALLSRYASSPGASRTAEAKRLLDEIEQATSEQRVLDALASLSDEEFAQAKSSLRIQDGRVSRPDLQRARGTLVKTLAPRAEQQRQVIKEQRLAEERVRAMEADRHRQLAAEAARQRAEQEEQQRRVAAEMARDQLADVSEKTRGNAFRDMSWGDPPTAGFTEISRSNNEVTYSRNADKLRIGDVAVEKIVYSFKDGKLDMVVLKYAPSGEESMSKV